MATEIMSVQETTRHTVLREVTEGDSDRLIDLHIEPNPHKAGRDEVQIIDANVPVWALIGYLDAVEGDVAQVAEDYEIPREAMLAALAYYRRNIAVIDARIEANSSTDDTA
jgi:uncharacterized protein (DUF433 family)